MATGNLNVDRDPAAAAKTFTDAIIAAGATITSQIPGQPVRFRLVRAGNFWREGYTSLKYEGSAQFVSVGAGRTQINLELNPASQFFFTNGAVALAIFFFGMPTFGFLLGPFAGFVIIALIGFMAWQVFQAAGPDARELMDGLLARLVPMTVLP